MEHVPFDGAATYEPEEGWLRAALAGSEQFSFEYFEKPPGHASPTHAHENEQVCLLFEGEVTAVTDDRRVTLGPYDSVLFEADEAHRVVNEGDAKAVGVDVFAPARPFDFWTDR